MLAIFVFFKITKSQKQKYKVGLCNFHFCNFVFFLLCITFVNLQSCSKSSINDQLCNFGHKTFQNNFQSTKLYRFVDLGFTNISLSKEVAESCHKKTNHQFEILSPHYQKWQHWHLQTSISFDSGTIKRTS